MHYIISACWLHLLDGLKHYVIHLGAIEQLLVMTNNLMNPGYTYSKRRLNNIPVIFHKITHTSRIIAWITSKLAWTPELREINQSLQRPSPPTAFSGTNHQEGPTTFDTSMRYML